MYAPREWHPGVAPHGDTGGRCLVAHIRAGVLQPSCVRCRCGEWVKHDEWSDHIKQPATEKASASTDG